MSHFIRFLLGTATLLLFVSKSGADKPRFTIQEIIDNVRANELLYENLDLSYDYSYGVGKPIRFGKPGEAGLAATDTVQSKTHFVSQGGLFRVDRQGELQGQNGRISMDRIRAFDGNTTRLYDRKEIGNIIDSRSEDENCLRPHMLLLRFMNYYVPLSTYLSGHKAMAAHPGVNWPGYTLDVTYQGIAKFESLTCHRVWITTLVNGKPYDRWELWLAEERNFIPARNLAYTFRTSDKEAVGEGTVKLWREVKPGIWFPEATTFTAWDETRMKQDGVKETQWVERVDIKKVSLHPQYDAAYFRDVTFPNGTPVYQVSQGNVLSGHVEGAPQNDAQPAKKMASLWWPLLWTNLAAVGLISFGVIAYRRLRRKQPK
ncbi:MAG TPA: hypothetical protein VK395_15140 [Gemmataceae bacterium]|nr:hypothetical protein [Gemmataceae bacterium]